MGACHERGNGAGSIASRNEQTSWYQNVSDYTSQQYNAASEYIGPKIV